MGAVELVFVLNLAFWNFALSVTLQRFDALMVPTSQVQVAESMGPVEYSSVCVSQVGINV